MFITSREKAIIELIIKTSGKHTALSMATFLNVSVRTIHRDLKTIENTLSHFELKLIRNNNDGLIIEGKNEQIFRLIQKLLEVRPVDQTPQERKLNLLIILLHEGKSFKIQSLASQLAVSVSTLTAYLDELTDWLSNYNVVLTRKRGVGIELQAGETEKRKALANFFLIYFNEELIEALFLLEKGNVESDKVIHYFNPEYLSNIDRLLSEYISKGQSRLADSDYIGLIVHICITMQRIKMGFRMEEVETDLPDEFQFMKMLCHEIEEQFKVHFSDSSIHYLAVILKGSKLQNADAVHYDSVILGQYIRNLITYVSSQLHVDLSSDFSLFQGLLAHLEPSIFRIKQKMAVFNPLTEDIRRKYPVLYMAVKNSLEKQFEDIDFPDGEIAFIVLHFGSALLLREEHITISSLVVCPTGIGTSKMLASRIKKEFIEIDSVDVKTIKEIQHADLSQYDLIISTVRLPFLRTEYILVNPLLSHDDIRSIRSYLSTNIKSFTRNKKNQGRAINDDGGPARKKRGIHEVLDEIKSVHASIESILNNFHVYRSRERENQKQVLAKMIAEAEKNKQLSNGESVLMSLEERERKGGLGIPHTGMALYHCRHSDIYEMIFQVTRLKEPTHVKGMDGNQMEMESLLLMIAPEELSAREQEIVSLISTSLIEDHQSILIFSSASEEAIKTKLEDIFLDYIQNNLIRND
ncbi:transcriptional antiterminator, BglG family [Bacillus sp. OV322]|uniref:BglG family transcription antiterminator n=1 Tax=Bacillus sp. OV322 TaxID=1882764 RepID=UPI0008EFA324|nr:PRD domain-containing protein [Bacillus sp. OV322]SFC81995.1 transcriptional antiterminator, BglG family [Bacillus sp. OV322]